MEACSGAHHWARPFQKLGHTARLMAPKFVAAYRLPSKRGNNGAADAAAKRVRLKLMCSRCALAALFPLAQARGLKHCRGDS
jgi:transposase